MKPILPKAWEPTRIDYDAWEEIHSRVHAQLAANAAGGPVPASRNINTTAPLSGGGNLSADLTLSITINGVTNALLAQMPASTFKGNNTGGLANAADLTAAQVKTLLAISFTDVSGTLQAAQFPTLTGDVTTPGGSLATTIAANAVTNAKAAQMPANTFKGNNTAGLANAVDLTATQATAQLNVFTSTLQGVVPASGGGSTAFLRADGTWSAPAYPVGANPSATIGLAAVNGAAATFLRSDGAPALSQSITPTWSGAHIWQSTMGATGSPLVPTLTQVRTGLANKKTGDSTDGTGVLTADAALTVTVNEAGYYQLEVFLGFYEAVLGTGGFQFDLNAGNATVGGILVGIDGFATAALANAAITSITTVTAAATVATASAAPSWYFATGSVQITGAGTFGVRWAQNTISVNLTTLKALSYITLTKIG